jgi:2-oxoglutarate ferredoxin oxidoreductase subunit delta
VSQNNAKQYWREPFDTREITRLRGDVSILEERCKGCAFCVEFCPTGVLALSERYNTKGYHPPDVVSPQMCTACHLCELLCPEFAIGIEELQYAGGTDEPSEVGDDG